MAGQFVFIIILLLLSLLVLLISVGLSMVMFRQYQNLPSSRIFIIQVLLTTWVGFIVYAEVARISPLLSQVNNIQHFNRLSLACLFLAFIIMSYMQINTLYDRRTRLFGTVALGGFNFNMAYVISDLFMGTSFFTVTSENSLLSITFSVTIALFIFISGVMHFVSFSFSMRRIVTLPDYLYSSSSIVRHLGLFILSIGSILLFFFFIVRGMIQPLLGTIMVFSLSVLSLVNVYFNYSQPFIQIGNGSNPVKLLDNNFIGFFVGTSLDSGPSIHILEQDFLAKSGLTAMQIQTTIVGVMTMIGINNSFAERLSLVPIPKAPEFISLNLTFQAENKEVKDTRYRDQAPSMLGIIMPAMMTPLIKNLSNLQDKFAMMLSTVDSIDQMSYSNTKQIVAKILHEVLN